MREVKEGYKMTELGEIPNEWNVKTLAELFSFAGGLSISRDKQSDQGAYYLHYGDIHKQDKNVFDTEKDKDWLPKIDVEEEKIKQEIILNTGDVVFADASEDYEGIGKSVVVFNDNKKKFISGLHTIVAKPTTNELVPHYKRYCFAINQVRKQFRFLAAGATVYGISRSNIGKIKIIIPPLPEQQKIADILSTIDEQIENVDRLIEKTKELKKGLMQQLLTKGIGHTEFKETEVGIIPKEWEVKKFKDICTINQGLQIAIEDRFKEFEDGRLPYITIQYLNNKANIDNTFYIEGANESVICQEEDILVTRTGNTGIIVTDEKGVFHNNFFRVNYDRTQLNKRFLYYYLTSTPIQKMIMKYAGTTTIPDLKHADFYRLPVIIPSYDEQEKVAKIILEVDNKIKVILEKYEGLKKIKKSLMQQLLTGRIRVKVD